MVGARRLRGRVLNCRASFVHAGAAPRATVAGARSVAAQAIYHGSVMATAGTKYAVVVAKFNSLITKGLLEGAMETFASHGVPAENVDVSLHPWPLSDRDNDLSSALYCNMSCCVNSSGACTHSVPRSTPWRQVLARGHAWPPIAA